MSFRSNPARLLRGSEAADVRPAIFDETRPALARSEAELAMVATAKEKSQSPELNLDAERQRSFEAGKRQGESVARAELAPVLERLNASLAEIVSLRSDLRRRAERDVVRLALLIAKRVLHRELTVDSGALTALARFAFERLAHSESYRVTVHPHFAPAIAAALPASAAERVRIEPDPAYAPGTLIVNSPEGTIDASVDAQLEEIGRGLADRLDSANR